MVEKVEKICIKWNFTPKNYFRRDSVFGWDSKTTRNIFGFSYKNLGGNKQSPLMTLVYFWILYPNMAFILAKNYFLGKNLPINPLPTAKPRTSPKSFLVRTICQHPCYNLKMILHQYRWCACTVGLPFAHQDMATCVAIIFAATKIVCIPDK